MAASNVLEAQVRFVEATPNEVAAITHLLTEQGEAAPGAGASQGGAALQSAGAKLVGVLFVVAAAAGGLGDVAHKPAAGNGGHHGGAGHRSVRATHGARRRRVEGLNVYRLEKGYRAWGLVFRGEPDVVGDERAVDLVDWLLKNPLDEAIHASVLENKVDGSPLADGAGAVEGDGTAVDLGGVIEEASGRKLMGSITLPALRKELAGHRQAMNDETLPQAERDDAERRLKVLVNAYSSGGVVAEGAAQAVERVRKAIGGLIEGLKRANRADGQPNATLRGFGEHLEEYLWRRSRGARGRAVTSGRAGCFIYEPPPGVVWRG